MIAPDSQLALMMFSATFIALYAGHHVGDHWVQTHRQALTKGAPGRAGKRACLGHVVTLTLTKLTALELLWLATGWVPSGITAGAALALDMISHYWADRQHTLAALAERLGKADFHQLGMPEAAPTGTGAYALDQSWHLAWTFITALIIAGGSW
ncbi:DUF3307 domain-containing protein [Nonomuraea roseoviolacea]|uniref:DUF3307 domain-containing protein n=1 Tax=Nonomuraea roseoviolacea subsp. carminata TaxID=160689 RepID=A0ABT1K999_9ACTN|nr:DUF3307 domain-containing protein [Nonomuraea roseoviolacea]MCP2350585.1 hypothetical protein [Nonomuraea roseoviolacea subsp. carminata]